MSDLEDRSAGSAAGMAMDKKVDYTDMIGDFISQNKLLYCVYLSVLLVFPAEALVFPHVFSHAMTKVQTSKSPSMKDLSRVAALWIGVQCLYLLMHSIDLVLVPRFDSFARDRVMDDIVTGFKENFTEPNTGSLMSGVLKLPEAARDLFSDMHHAVFADAVLLVCTIGYYFWVSRTLGAVFLVGVIAWSIVTYFFNKACSKKTYAKELKHGSVHEQIEEVVSNLIAVFVYDTGGEELQRLRLKGGDYTKLLKDSLNCAFNFRVLYAVIVVCVFLGIMATSVALVKAGSMQQATFVAVFIVTFTTMGRLMAGYTSIKTLQHSLGIIKATSKTVNDTLGKGDGRGGVSGSDDFDVADLTMKDVSYTIGDREILRDCNVTFPQGKVMALVGPIGSGKSTCSRLLMRLDRPTSGDITTGGKSVYDMSLSAWRRQVAYVPQTPKLTSRTLRENLTYGGGIKDAEKAISVLRSIGMSDVAKIFEDRLDESVGKGGSNLSGGQRQIVWLLRACLSDAKLIVMDEVTSALDVNSRDMVIKFIHTAISGKTIILVTHDLALLSKVDEIYEVRNKTIVRRRNKGGFR